jgi:2-iminobutanoate/2-iminopropanoate deaminase
MGMEEVFTLDAPKPGGHYSQAVMYGNNVYVSGQLPIDPKTGEKRLGTVEEQTRRALENLDAVLEAAGGSRNHVLKTNVYISDIKLWDRVNKVYAEFFGSHRPARTVVPTRDLHFGFLVELDAVAFVER